MKQRIKDMAPTLLGVAAILYLSFHILQGDRGLLAYPERERDIEDKREQLSSLEKDVKIWERRVALLQRENLDADMLEERARAMLNYTRPDEVLILLEPDT